MLRGVCTLPLFALLLALRVPAEDAAPTATEPSSPPPAAQQAETQPAPAPTYEITGTARSGKTPLPGATVTASNTLTGKKYSAVTDSEGKFSFAGIVRGRYVLRIEFMGFSLFTQEVALNPANPSGKIDAELTLASREQEQSNRSNNANVAAGRGFQSLALGSALTSLAGGNGGFGGNGAPGVSQSSSDLSSLPLNGAGAEGPTESISISGAQGRTQDFGAGSEQDLQDRIQEFRERMQREGFGGSGGGPGGGGQGGMGGPIMIGRMGGRGFNINQPHGVLYFSDDTSSLDATPFSLSGFPTSKSQYNQSHFGANVGGPLNIPRLFNGGNKWFFFAGWNGSRGDTPYDYFSTVPTLRERNGNFSNATYRNGAPVEIFNPATDQQYQSNGVPNAIDPSTFSQIGRAHV